MSILTLTAGDLLDLFTYNNFDVPHTSCFCPYGCDVLQYGSCMHQALATSAANVKGESQGPSVTFHYALISNHHALCNTHLPLNCIMVFCILDQVSALTFFKDYSDIRRKGWLGAFGAQGAVTFGK